jgi:hypothetical protein
MINEMEDWVDSEFGRMCKEVVVSHFNVLFQHLDLLFELKELSRENKLIDCCL